MRTVLLPRISVGGHTRFRSGLLSNTEVLLSVSHTPSLNTKEFEVQSNKNNPVM